MRPFLIFALLLSLVSACSSVKLGPHRIDVQQGNALDQENIARLKTGLNRSQVRFLMGTPLVVDPFRTDRWDYVYVNYKAGKLAEQKRISLFFDGETLVRIEGDVPPSAPAPAVSDKTASGSPTHAQAEPLGTAAVEASPLRREAAPQAEPIPAAVPASAAAAPKPEPVAAPRQETAARPVPPAAPRVETASRTARVAESPAARSETSVVKPLPSPSDVPAYRDPRTPGELSLQAETSIEQLKPDVIPTFPETSPSDVASPSASAADNDAVLRALRKWATAWSKRDEDAYLAAYDADFVPQGPGTRADWEHRRRALLGVARSIEVRIDSPSIDYLADGSASVIFTQHYRSDNFRDVVVKQIRMVQRGAHWLIIEEKVVSVLQGGKR